MWRSPAVVLCLCVFASGCDSRSDVARLQGDWQLWQMNGWFEFDLPVAGKGGSTKISFSDNQFTFMNDANPKQRISGTFVCDQAKHPCAITFRFADRSIVGIYSLSGRTLQLCFGREDSVPPPTFEGGPGERPALLVFHRPEVD